MNGLFIGDEQPAAQDGDLAARIVMLSPRQSMSSAGSSKRSLRESTRRRPSADKGKAREKAEDRAGDQAIKTSAYSEEVYSDEEESLRNDLSQAYLNTGHRPQNWLQGVDLNERFSEYPKLAKLLSLHSDLVEHHAHPPTFLSTDLRSFPLTDLLPLKFDCILIDPPLEEYGKTYPGNSTKSYWTWDELANLPIPQITASPGFIWLWVGQGKADEHGVSGVDKGRELLAKWGYRRCEDIVWLKTNKKRHSLEDEPATDTLLTHTKEHCLMGIRGTVKRSTDGHFVHCNVDTDVILWEGDEQDPLHKPPELYNIIENFCLGTRRLELFGSSKNLRRGWLTVGLDLESTAHDESCDATGEPQALDKELLLRYFSDEAAAGGANLVPSTAEIEILRPRSPPGSKTLTFGGHGMKSNPQGIGRHTNRSATPSASQKLELDRMQKQFGSPLQTQPMLHTFQQPPPSIMHPGQLAQHHQMMMAAQQQALLFQQQQYVHATQMGNAINVVHPHQWPGAHFVHAGIPPVAMMPIHHQVLNDRPNFPTAQNAGPALFPSDAGMPYAHPGYFVHGQYHQYQQFPE